MSHSATSAASATKLKRTVSPIWRLRTCQWWNCWVYTQQFHHWQVLNRQMGDTVRFSLVAEAADVAECDTLIYYWPKNKPCHPSGG